MPLFAFTEACNSGFIICAGRNYLEFPKPVKSRTRVQALKSNEEGFFFLFPLLTQPRSSWSWSLSKSDEQHGRAVRCPTKGKSLNNERLRSCLSWEWLHSAKINRLIQTKWAWSNNVFPYPKHWAYILVKEDKAPYLPVSLGFDCLTKRNMRAPLEGELLEPLLTPWIWQRRSFLELQDSVNVCSLKCARRSLLISDI